MFLNPPPPLPENISTPPEYNLNLSEKSQPLPKKSQPLPKKSQPLSKKCQPLPKKNVNSASLIIPNRTQKISTRSPKNCQPLRKNVTSTEKFNPSRLNPLPRKFLIPPPTPENFSTPPRKFLKPLPKISQPLDNFSTPPENISTPLKKYQPQKYVKR